MGYSHEEVVVKIGNDQKSNEVFDYVGDRGVCKHKAEVDNLKA